jgi:uncharacterized membrane protein
VKKELTNFRIILLVSSLMSLVSLYMSWHYFTVYFPDELNSGSSCNFSSFWSCDQAVFSNASSIWGVPSACLGAFFGLFVFLSTYFSKYNLDKANYFLAFLNACGCCGFLLYSLVFLNGLCPACTAYYILSFGLLFSYWFFSEKFLFHKKSFFVFSCLFLLYFSFLSWALSKKHEGFAEVSTEIVEDFLHSEDFSNLKIDSKLYLTKDNKDFYKAPLHITIFSDFECPACQALAQMIPRIKMRYKDKVKIQFVPFSMNSECNPLTEFVLHPFACKAAYAGVCSYDFNKTHDFLFDNQFNFSDPWFEENFSPLCVHSNLTSDKVRVLASYAKDYKITSTPTLIINGKKLEGLLPVSLLFRICDQIL